MLGQTVYLEDSRFKAIVLLSIPGAIHDNRRVCHVLAAAIHFFPSTAYSVFTAMVISGWLMPEKPKLKLMVASTVYHFEDQLDQICAVLAGYGYAVWNSRQGTIPTDPRLSNLDNCIAAARSCDLFLGIIRPFYGSGLVGDTSITHEEFRAALAAGKPNWFLVHRNVTLARQLLKPYLFDESGGRAEFQFKKTAVLDDIRVFDMYEEATRESIPLAERTGNWVQEFGHEQKILQFLEAQFEDIQRVRAICERKGMP